ncbi:MAG: hypothetical protein EXR79_01000 [Myxococcales bacterium]|nr:hypothetical protein [Myxococcales bacterium]
MSPLVAIALGTLAAAASPTEAGPTGAFATAPKPAGFRYSMVTEVWVESLGETYLYVRRDKKSTSTTPVPVPADRVLLAQCVTGGTLDDLVPGTLITAKFDNRGVVRPEIVIIKASSVEVLDGAKVLDRGGNKLYVITSDGQSRGFALPAGPGNWAAAVTNGSPDGLKPGVVVQIKYDPSGRADLRITYRDPPPPAPPVTADKGCGCGAVPGRVDGAALGLALSGAVLWLRARRGKRKDRVHVVSVAPAQARGLANVQENHGFMPPQE